MMADKWNFQGFPIAYYLPETCITNDDLVKIFKDFDPIRVFDQTGVGARRYCKSNETALDLAVKACEKLFSDYKIDSNTIDFILYVTQCPDYKLPATSCILQNSLGLKHSCGAFDINLGCSGFTYALSAAKGYLASGEAENILIVTADNLSKYIHEEDRALKSLIGDAAAACLITKENISKIGRFIFGTDGAGFADIIINAGGERMPISEGTKKEFPNKFSEGMITSENLTMNGINVFTFAITSMPPVIKNILAKNNLEKDDVDFYVFHQANKTILEYLKKKAGVSEEKFYINLKETGNTSSVTIPLALKMAEDEGRLREGMKVMVLGFGVGLSWCGTVLEW